MILWFFARTGAEPVALFALVLVNSFFAAGVIAVTMGPMTSSSVPDRLASSATGLVIGCGEIFGGAAAPFVAGMLMQQYGIDRLPLFAGVVTGIGFLVSLIFMKEPKRAVANPASAEPVREH